MRYFISAGAILFFIVTFTPRFTTATRQQCAPLVPPPVSGSLVQPQAVRGILFINEVLLNPHHAWNCSEPAASYSRNDTWIEIYNAQDQPLDLYSVHASLDNGSNTNLFYFPFGSAIAPHSFLVIFPYNLSTSNQTNVSQWRLLISGIPIDEVTVPPLAMDQSYARVSDGGPTWAVTSAPTIDASDAAPTILTTPTVTKIEATAIARTQKSPGKNSGKGTTNRGTVGAGGGNTTGTSTTSGGQPRTDGVQPGWSSLQHPAVLPTAISTTKMSNPVFTKTQDGLDVPHKILLTVLLVALAVALTWCWRLFSKPAR